MYAARNAEVLTCHEVQVKEISTQQSWVEVDPLEIWQNVLECIQVAVQNLVILDINPDDICALALTNRRDTTVLWHKHTGRPLYNAIGKFSRNGIDHRFDPFPKILKIISHISFQPGMIAVQHR